MGEIDHLSSILQWQIAAHQRNREKGFYDGGGAVNIDKKLLLAIGELIEAQNEHRAGHPYIEVYFNGNNLKPEGFGIELADAVLRICDIAEFLGIDLGRCMVRKHEYNGTRPYKHGKAY